MFFCVEKIYYSNFSKENTDPTEWLWNNKKIAENSNLVEFFKMRLANKFREDEDTHLDWFIIYLNILPTKFSTLLTNCSMEEAEQLPRTTKSLFQKQLLEFNVMCDKVYYSFLFWFFNVISFSNLFLSFEDGNKTIDK